MAYQLGDYLRKLRGNLSLREVAARSNGKLSHNAIAQAEKGLNSRGASYKPTPETLKELARIYHADYQQLMEMAGYMSIKEARNSWAHGMPVNMNNVVEANETIPVYGQIHAGPPSFADQDVIGVTPATSKIVREYGRDNLFALQVKGDSMSRVLPDGYIAVFAKDIEPEDNDIVATLIDGDDATVKRFKETSMAIMFEPDSYNPIYKPIVFQKKGKQDFRILGKYLYATSMPI